MASPLAEEKAKLKARLAEIEQAERADRQKREMIAGRVVLNVAEADSTFDDQLRRMLDTCLTRKRERAAFGLDTKDDNGETAAADDSDGRLEAASTTPHQGGWSERGA